MGEISDFAGYNSKYDWYEFVTVRPVKDYVGSTNGENIYLLNGPESACIKSFDYDRGSQLIILATETDRIEDGKKVFRSSFCNESVVYYDRAGDIIRGNIHSISTPQNDMTLHEMEQLIRKIIDH